MKKLATIIIRLSQNRFYYSLIISSFLLSSCVLYNQESLHLNLSANKQLSSFGGNKSVVVEVKDERANKDLLGNKRLGNELIAIKSEQNLAETIKDKVAKDLEQNGFLVSSNSNLENKTLEVKILTLNYKAYREFFIGTSKIDILLKITAKNQDASKSYSTTQNFSLSKNHFIMPLITTDEKTINFALQESLNGIFDNQKLLDFLNY